MRLGEGKGGVGGEERIGWKVGAGGAVVAMLVLGNSRADISWDETYFHHICLVFFVRGMLVSSPLIHRLVTANYGSPFCRGGEDLALAWWDSKEGRSLAVFQGGCGRV